MKLTKRILALGVAMAMLLSATACSKDEDEGDGDEDTTQGEDAEQSKADGETEAESDAGTADETSEPTPNQLGASDGVYVDFAVMAFNNRAFTIPAGMDIKVGGNLGPKEGGEGGGAADAIKIIGFQGYPEPKDAENNPLGFLDGGDSTWQILIAQNGEFWDNVDRIEASFYLEGDSESEDISNVETFMQGGALWSWDYVNSGENLLNQFSEDNGGEGFHWGDVMTATWDIPNFVKNRVDGGRNEEDFKKPPMPVNPDDETSDKEGGGVNKFGLSIQTDNPVDNIDGRIVWTAVTIYVYDLELFQQFVDEVTEVTGVEPSDGALEHVEVVARP